MYNNILGQKKEGHDDDDNQDIIQLEPHNIEWLTDKGWYDSGQRWLEKTYLQPFKDNSNRQKINTRNGYIEREIHGAMHASRVAWSTTMLHHLCQQQYPEAVQHRLHALLKYFDVQENEVLCLIRYVALGHDAARQGENEDQWEAKSAQLIKHFLENHGIESGKANILSKLACLKDAHQQLKIDLGDENVSDDTIEGLQYARLLISLSDCFDMIRCNSSFDFQFIEDRLTEVFDEYQPERDAPGQDHECL